MKSDGDPIHPNWDGIVFNASTDRTGLVIHPSSAQTQPPYTYLPIGQAIAVYGDLRAVIYGLESHDPNSYLAHFLEEVAQDMADAIEICRPAPEPVPETSDAPASDVQESAPG